MILRLRTAIAIGMAIAATLITLGHARVDWSGRRAVAGGPEDPSRPAVAHTHDATRPRLPS